MTSEAAPRPRAGSGAMFDRIARRYDLLNRLTSLGMDQGWRRKAVAALRLPARARVLDLATGTADLALAISRSHHDAEVWGLDPGLAMLALASRKTGAAGERPRVRLVAGIAEDLPFGDASFDGCSMAFGIRNVPERPAALREILRVLRPGGRLAILELTTPTGRGPVAGLARWHIRHVVPRAGAWLSGWQEYRYLEQSITAFPPPVVFADTLRAQGFDRVEIRPLGFGACTLFCAVRPEFAAEEAHP